MQHTGKQPPVRAALRALVAGAWQAQCLRAAAELRLPGHLAAGPASSAELAAACAAHEPSLRRLLRILTAMGLLSADGAGKYALTPLGEELGSDRLGPYAVYFGSEPAWSAWAALAHAVRTGERAFDDVHGMRNWQYFAAHPETGAGFQAAMASLTAGVSGSVAGSYDFSRFPVVADIGGGDGTLLAEILRRCPQIRGVLADLPHVVDLARPALREAGVLERCSLHGADFRTAVPPADAYVLKSVLHDWADEDVIVILERCREAACPHPRLIIVERVLPEQVSRGDLEALLTDLNMMVMLGGRERTAAEFRQLLDAAGWRPAQILPTGTEFSVIEATPC